MMKTGICIVVLFGALIKAFLHVNRLLLEHTHMVSQYVFSPHVNRVPVVQEVLLTVFHLTFTAGITNCKLFKTKQVYEYTREK